MARNLPNPATRHVLFARNQMVLVSRPTTAESGPLRPESPAHLSGQNPLSKSDEIGPKSAELASNPGHKSLAEREKTTEVGLRVAEIHRSWLMSTTDSADMGPKIARARPNLVDAEPISAEIALCWDNDHIRSDRAS